MKYKLIDTISGEIIECIYRDAILEEGHNRIENYKEMYNKNYYLDFVNTITYKLKEYKREERK